MSTNAPGPLPSLPLICPTCLARDGSETELRQVTCTACGFAPEIDGTLVDFLDDEESNRQRFYDEVESYLRESVDAQDPQHWLGLTEGLSGLVLEIGSGRGAYAGLGGNDYVALDYSRNHLLRFLGNRQRIRASAELVPLRSASCRFIFTIATFEHVPDPSRAFDEIARLLTPGGVAYISPAWHCRPWAAEGLPVRPYSDLSWPQKVRKALIPIRDSLLWRGVFQIPWRVYRRTVAGSQPRLKWTPLQANYEHFWLSDSDACAAIDSHEGVLYFERRGFDILRPDGGVVRRLLFRAGPLIVRKRAL